MAPLLSVFSALQKVTPTNHYLLINIHPLRYIHGHQGQSRLHQGVEEPLTSLPQEGILRHSEGGGGGGEEDQGATGSEEGRYAKDK